MLTAPDASAHPLPPSASRAAAAVGGAGLTLALGLAVAALPVAVGLGGAEYADPVAFDAAYASALLVCAALLAAGGAISWLTIRDPGI